MPLINKAAGASQNGTLTECGTKLGGAEARIHIGPVSLICPAWGLQRQVLIILISTYCISRVVSNLKVTRFVVCWKPSTPIKGCDTIVVSSCLSIRIIRFTIMVLLDILRLA